MSSFTEENYLKAIYSLNKSSSKGATTTALAKRLDTKASSVTDILKRMSEKGMVNYKKYQGATLTTLGSSIALNVIRKHRLWEVFLVEKLNFKWNEVHEIAEQLEHIKSPILTDRLDVFLGNPEFDPHGDPIPNKEGLFSQRKQHLLSELNKGEEGVIIGVKDSSSKFLNFLESKNLILGRELTVTETIDYDGSVSIELADRRLITLSNQVSVNLIVSKK